MKIEKSTLVKQFEEFYKEIIIQKKNAITYGETQVPKIRKELVTLLDKQKETIRQKTDIPFEQALYPMVVLADEIFINLKWAGKKEWQDKTLEAEYYKGIRHAGVEFFDRADKILNRKDIKQEDEAEIAVLFFLALSLGFKGKFRESNNKLELYRKKLFSFIFDKAPDIAGEKKELFPEAHRVITKEKYGEKLPFVGRWVWLIAGLFFILLVMSHGIWINSTANLVQKAEIVLSKSGVTEFD